jgi:integrase
MPINKLKDRLIETLPSGPKGRPKVYADGGGLYLIVRGKSRSYGFRATLNGRQLPMMYLGSTKKKSLATARKERDRNNELVAEGKDPRAVKVAEKVQQDIGPPPTVTRLLNRYFETKIEPERQFDTKDKRLERINKARRFLDQIRDAMGKMPVSEVKVETILNTLGLEELSKISPSSSWELRRHLKRAFSMAEALGWRDGCDPRNPASDDLLNAILTNGYHKREPRAALDYKDAPRFVAEVKARTNHGLGEADQPLSPAPALLFLVYTGVRTQEVRDARWREIDWENLLWNVPSDHRKAGYKKNKVRAATRCWGELEANC